ncbi:MAG: hypothetical protein ACD_65C00238G0002 [uncultured bacterium]|nr:MAG: hypothetical protein ACD_65C00238G0002 [uncultured bacterium]
MDKTIGCIETHFLFTVIFRVFGFRTSNPSKKGSMFPSHTLFGICIFMANISIPGIHTKCQITGIPGKYRIFVDPGHTRYEPMRLLLICLADFQ